MEAPFMSIKPGKITLKREPGYIYPKPSVSDVTITSLGEMPDELPYGDINLTPTRKSLHDILNIFRYYALPSKESGRIRLLGDEKEEKFPVPENIDDLESIKEWLKSIFAYVGRTHARNYRVIPSARMEAVDHGLFMIFHVLANAQNTGPLTFNLAFYISADNDIIGIIFSWKWENPEQINSIYEGKIKELLTHEDIIDWRVGDPNFHPIES
jgi:hypothetical protein